MQTGTGRALRLAKRHVLWLVPLAASCALFQPAKVIEPRELARGTYVIDAPGYYRLGGDAVR